VTDNEKVLSGILGFSVLLWLFSKTTIGANAVNEIIQTISDSGLKMIENFEGFEAMPYPDPPGSGKFSVGYGHQIQQGEDFSNGVDEATAQMLLAQDVQIAQNVIYDDIQVALSPSQFDALTSFIFNVGTGSAEKGTVLDKINAGDFSGAAATMKEYIHSGGKINNELIARREVEAAPFMV
jgi:lysozyme